MDDQNVKELIMNMLVAEGYGADSATVQTALSNGGLRLSSLELVRLLVSLEDRLGISLDDATIMNARFDTVDDIVSLVTQAA